MKRLKTMVLCAMCLVCLGAVFPQGVDQDEFSGILDKVINFSNYQGRYQRVDSLQAIQGIGSTLAAGVVRDKTSTGNYGVAYRVLHILGTPEEKGKPADIIELLPAAGVDHIDNIRRIVSAYLTGAYGYARKDADLLAFYITIYNAVYRGNLDFFAKRFKPAVLQVLTAEKAGLAITWQDWAGKTQLVIPLGVAVATVGEDNKLSSISTAELVGPQVLETVRDTPDKSTDKRADMANLIDRTVDQEQAAIEAERARLAQEKADLLSKPTPVPGSATATPVPSPAATAAGQPDSTKPGPQPSATPAPGADRTANQPSPAPTPAPAEPAKAGSGQPAAAATTEPQPSPQPAATAAAATTADQQKLDEIAKKEAELQQREAQNKELDEAGRTLRQNTAEDLNKDQSATLVSENLVYLKTRLESGLLISGIQKVNTVSGDVLAEGKDYGILNRQVQDFAGQLLCLVKEGDSTVLALISGTDLAIVKKSSAVLSPWSQVVILPGGKECLAVLQQDGAWYLGRFDASLNPLARSAIPVDPYGVINVRQKTILVQRQDGRATILNLDDLRTAR